MPIKQLLNTLTLMKSSIIHDNHAFSFKTWNKCELTPVIKYIAINVLLKVIKRKKHFFIESSDDIRTLYRVTLALIVFQFNGVL